jgi:surfactin synthase thioesterase subunit
MLSFGWLGPVYRQHAPFSRHILPLFRADAAAVDRYAFNFADDGLACPVGGHGYRWRGGTLGARGGPVI